MKKDPPLSDRLFARLVLCAERTRIVTYGKVAETLKSNHRCLGNALDKVAKRCSEEKLPHLESLVVGANGETSKNGPLNVYRARIPAWQRECFEWGAQRRIDRLDPDEPA